MSYRSPRLPATSQADLTTATGTYVVEVRNVSDYGLAVYGAPPLCRAEKVRVFVAGREEQALVSWSHGKACGLRLLNALTEIDIAILRKVPRKKVGVGQGSGRAMFASRFRECEGGAVGIVPRLGRTAFDASM